MMGLVSIPLSLQCTTLAAISLRLSHWSGPSKPRSDWLTLPGSRPPLADTNDIRGSQHAEAARSNSRHKTGKSVFAFDIILQKNLLLFSTEMFSINYSSFGQSLDIDIIILPFLNPLLPSL